MECTLEGTSPSGVCPGGSAVNPSSGQMAGNLGPLSAHGVTFSFRVTFQTTMTWSAMEPSPGPAIPKTQSSIPLCFGLICDVSRRQGPIGIAEGLLPGRAHLNSPLRCRCLPWGGEPWRSLEPTPGIMLSDGSHPNRCGLAQGGSCHSRQKAVPGPQKPLYWGLFWCSHVPPNK